MDDELRGTRLAESFATVSTGPAATTVTRGTAAAAAAASGAASTSKSGRTAGGTIQQGEHDTGGQGDGEGDLLPVDLDMNLVRSLVASYGAQAGLPGPAGNLAGLLGFQLPDSDDEMD